MVMDDFVYVLALSVVAVCCGLLAAITAGGVVW